MISSSVAVKQISAIFEKIANHNRGINNAKAYQNYRYIGTGHR